MKRNHSNCLFVVALAATILVCTIPKLMAQSTISLGERIAKSQLIVIGKVTHIESRWEKGRRAISTYVTISIEELIKGAGQSGIITVSIPGGVIKEENIGMMLSERMPGFDLNERTLVMLGLMPDQTDYYVIDPPYGKYTVSPAGAVGPTKKMQQLIEEIRGIVASGK